MGLRRSSRRRHQVRRAGLVDGWIAGVIESTRGSFPWRSRRWRNLRGRAAPRLSLRKDYTQDNARPSSQRLLPCRALHPHKTTDLRRVRSPRAGRPQDPKVVEPRDVRPSPPRRSADARSGGVSKPSRRPRADPVQPRPGLPVPRWWVRRRRQSPSASSYGVTGRDEGASLPLRDRRVRCSRDAQPAGQRTISRLTWSDDYVARNLSSAEPLNRARR